MRIDLRPGFALDIGRSDYQRRDAGIFLGFGWRADADIGEIPWRHTLEITWDWLPRLCWVDDGPSWDDLDVIYSALWTGRTYRLYSWSWHFRVHWF